MAWIAFCGRPSSVCHDSLRYLCRASAASAGRDGASTPKTNRCPTAKAPNITAAPLLKSRRALLLLARTLPARGGLGYAATESSPQIIDYRRSKSREVQKTMSNRLARDNRIRSARCRWLFGAMPLVLLLLPSIALGQIRAGTITGTVSDASKSVVPGATVIVTNEATNVATELVTNEAGVYTALYLPAGTYKVAISMAGFAPVRANRDCARLDRGGPHGRRARGRADERDGHCLARSATSPDRPHQRVGRRRRRDDRSAPRTSRRTRCTTPCSRPGRLAATAPRTRPASTRSASASTDGATGRPSASTGAGRSLTTSSSTACR